MVDPDIQEQILRDLERLSPKLQRRALALVRSLDSSLERGASMDDLITVSGILDKESAREMLEAVEKYCGKVAKD